MFRQISRKISGGSSEDSSGQGKKTRGGKKEEIKRLEQAVLEMEKRAEQNASELQKRINFENEMKRLEEEKSMEMERYMSENDAERQRRKGVVMDLTEINAEKIDFSQGTMGLVDRLEAHPAGKLLKNVVISNEPPPDREINLVRLRKYKPQNDFSKLTLGEIPPFDLTSDYMEFQITEAMTQAQQDNLKSYVLVSDVFIHYIPLDSFYSTSSPVIFQLNDFRKVDDPCMRKYPLTHSGGYNILMTLDYCIARKDLHHLTLSVSTSLSSFRKEVSWGAIKVLITISHMDFPVKANIQETMGVLHLSDSDLQDFISDPRHSDGVITPQALKMLKQSYKRGEIENINLPRDDTKQVNYAKTNVGEDQSDYNAHDLLVGLREKALEQQRQKNVEFPKSKPAIKHSRNFSQATVSDDDGDDGMGDLKDIEVGETLSDTGSNDTTELPRRDDSPRRGLRSVNFG